MASVSDTPKGPLSNDPLTDLLEATNIQDIEKDRRAYGTSIDAAQIAMMDAYYANEFEIKPLTEITSIQNCKYCYDNSSNLVACVLFLSNLQYGSMDEGEIDFVRSFDQKICDKIGYTDWGKNLTVSGKFVQDNTMVTIYNKPLQMSIGGQLKKQINKTNLKNFIEKVYGNINEDDLTEYLLNMTPASEGSPTFVTTVASLLETFIRKNIDQDFLVEIKNLKHKLKNTKLSDITNTTNTYVSGDAKLLIEKITDFKRRLTRLLGMFDTPLDILRNIVKIIWVPKEFLYRPCYNYKSKNDVICSLNGDTSPIGKKFEEYIRTFPKYVEPEQIKNINLSQWNFPFTRIGYTYDVENVDSTNVDYKVGVSEFILLNGTPFQVMKILSIEDFIDILLDTFDGNGNIVANNSLENLIEQNRVPVTKIGGGNNYHNNYHNKYIKYKSKYSSLQKSKK